MNSTISTSDMCQQTGWKYYLSCTENLSTGHSRRSGRLRGLFLCVGKMHPLWRNKMHFRSLPCSQKSRRSVRSSLMPCMNALRQRRKSCIREDAQGRTISGISYSENVTSADPCSRVSYCLSMREFRWMQIAV